MNNYDDIKRFKEKLNMEAIDYKEIAESNPNNSAHNWAIIKQVATADEPFQPLEHGLSTQPTPASVGNKEFNAPVSAPAQPTLMRAQPASAPPQQAINAAGGSPAPQDAGRDAFASPLLNALGKALPAASRTEAANAAATIFSDCAQAGNAGHGAIFADKTFANNALPDTLFPDNTMAPAHAPSQPATPVRKPENMPDAMPFNQLFNRKSRQSAVLPARNMPLLQLLETIALCR